MTVLLILAVGLLSFANGANDNFKAVATLRGAGLTNYRRAIAWATGFTFLGSLTAVWLGTALAAKFSGAKLVDSAVISHLPFLTAIALGAGVTAAGFSHVRFAALGRGFILPLLFSPIIALVLTLGIQLVVIRLGWRRRKELHLCG
jgi:PiT family inorganic phosphate transporter